MQPAMSVPEVELFCSFLRCCSNYVEFGTGGSTILACSLVRTSVTSVDSSPDWLKMVEGHCAAQPANLKPTLVHADIGPTRDLGYPQDDRFRNLWPNYHSWIWSDKAALGADLFLVDGRFRVACFIQALLRASHSSVIIIHDFANRPHYHVIKEFSHEIAAVETLSVFQRRIDFDKRLAKSCLADHGFDPN